MNAFDGILRQSLARLSQEYDFIEQELTSGGALLSYRLTMSSLLLLSPCLFGGGLAGSSYAQGQVLNQDKEILVPRLPAVTAHSQDPSDILSASLETIFHDPDVCCGTNSALGDSALVADAKSLKDIAEKLAGRHLLSDGRSIRVTAQYVASDAISGGPLIAMVLHEHAALIQWNSHLYVLHGVIYRWTESGDPTTGSATRMTVIHKLLLWDARFSDSRRDVVFDRTTDDLSKLRGLLFLQTAPQ